MTMGLGVPQATCRMVALTRRYDVEETMNNPHDDLSTTQEQWAALFAKLLWAGTLTENGDPPTPTQRESFWVRARYRLRMAWYHWGLRVHLGDCENHCDCHSEDYL